jgi:diguanylate cyclase (GGDEF)-like protein
MFSVENTIKIISETNYFSAWTDVLLGQDAVDGWNLLIQSQEPGEYLKSLGTRLYEQDVPFVIVSEYIDEFFRYHKTCTIDSHNIKNKIAQAYLHKKLQADNYVIDKELSKKLSVALEAKQELINAHLMWMKRFILNLVGQPQYLELDHTLCHVGKWLSEEGPEEKHPQIYEKHKNLHAMAQSAIRMYNKEDYGYFLLLYLDILMSSFQIRDLIMNLYFRRRFTSIYKDPLTGVANYFQLKNDIVQETSNHSLLMLNIKEFSKINLLYGHDVGDKIIKEIVDFISRFDTENSVYRVYGDEFAILFPTKNKEIIVVRMKEALEREAFLIDDTEIVFSFYGSVSSVSAHVLERCEYGLMLSKAHHGEVTDVDTIDENLLKKYANNITLSQQLRLAFMDNRIIPYYQPLYDLKTNKITKYEILMRVIDIHGNIMEPREFLGVLQGMYIYPEVTKLMVENAFDVFKDNELEFSINLSFADINNIDTEGFILAILKKYPDVARRCTFELLETEAIYNHKEVCDFFDSLHGYGVKLALDDFGAGYSNYDTIFKFDIDYIKIDGSLTSSVLSSQKSLVLMESIIKVSKSIEAKVILEYVSSKEIYDFVSTLDVDYLQGYYIGKPMAGFVETKVE